MNQLTAPISQEDYELQVLHQQHLQNMLLLEKERQLLEQQNPYRQEFAQLQVAQSKLPPLASLPLYHSDPAIERMLYSKPSRVEHDVADTAINSILNNWEKQCSYIPKDLQFRNALKKNRNVPLHSELTDRGRLDMEELFQEAKKIQKTSQISLKDKYTTYYKPREPLSQTTFNDIETKRKNNKQH